VKAWNKASRRELVPGFTERRICCSSYQVHYMCKCAGHTYEFVVGSCFVGSSKNNKLDGKEKALQPAFDDERRIAKTKLGRESWHAFTKAIQLTIPDSRGQTSSNKLGSRV